MPYRSTIQFSHRFFTDQFFSCLADAGLLDRARTKSTKTSISRVTSMWLNKVSTVDLQCPCRALPMATLSSDWFRAHGFRDLGYAPAGGALDADSCEAYFVSGRRRVRGVPAPHHRPAGCPPGPVEARQGYAAAVLPLPGYPAHAGGGGGGVEVEGGTQRLHHREGEEAGQLVLGELGLAVVAEGRLLH
eukprot:408008-Prorocentrum_minimum.AAC.2